MVEVRQANQQPSWEIWEDILSSRLASIGACSATKAGQRVAGGMKESVCGTFELSCPANMHLLTKLCGGLTWRLSQILLETRTIYACTSNHHPTCESNKSNLRHRPNPPLDMVYFQLHSQRSSLYTICYETTPGGCCTSGSVSAGSRFYSCQPRLRHAPESAKKTPGCTSFLVWQHQPAFRQITVT